MLLTRTMQDRLISAWHGPLTADAVARHLRLSSARRVQEFWQKAKRDGRLPDDQPRPFFVDAAPAPAGPVDSYEAFPGERNYSDADIARETKLRHRINAKASDALLAALRGAHGDLDHPDFHTYATAPRRLGGIGR